MVTFKDIEIAHNRISKYVYNTPIMTSKTLNNDTGAKLFFKCENFQKTGSFKIRGATNAILQLKKADIQKGIITSSSGNHGAAVSYTAREIGASSQVIMPENTTKNKIDNVKRYGGRIIFCEPNIKSREQTLEKIVNKLLVNDRNLN